MKKRLWVFIAVAALLLASCGPATVPTTSPETASGENFMIALPRIVVDYDAAGNPSKILGIDLSMLPFQIDALKLPPETVAMLTSGNIQHIELAFVGHGVVVHVNGKPMPFISWDDGSLDRALNLAGALGVQNTEVYKQLVPMLTRLGIDLVLRFPLQPGAAEIALTDPGEAAKLSITPTTEPPSVIVTFEIKYDENGTPAILGITAADLAALGIPLPVGMPPSTIESLQVANIQNAELLSSPSGMFVYVNGEVLPNLSWDTALLTNLANLIVQLSPNPAYNDLIMGIVPSLDRLDLDILIHFPLAPGAEPIPAEMHR
jgi:sulfur carrier protein ThiS